MQPQLRIAALCAIVTLAACSTDTVAPPATARPNLRLSNSRQATGKYLVLMKNRSVPTGFTDKVASLGGKVRLAHAGAGFAFVSGLTADGAAQLAASAGVAEVDADFPVGLNLPTSKVTSDATDLGLGHSTSGPAAALHYNWQWNMRLIQADKAWGAGKLGSPDVTVAILDTGIDYDGVDLNGHVDLSRSVSFMSDWVGGPDDIVTASDDALVASQFPGRNPISDLNGHGTNVASQVTSSGLALAGVTSKTTLIGVKVLGANGSGTFGGILSGILWAADHGANVANMSLGGSFPTTGNGQLIDVINAVFGYARSQNMVVVVSAGNESTNLDTNGDTFAGFCDADFVICVSAVGPERADQNPDKAAFYTNFGAQSVDVAAPGGNADFPKFKASKWPWGSDIASWVWSRCSRQELVFETNGTPHPDGCGVIFNYTGFIGTSQASPHVTGLAALIVADNPNANPETIKQIIQDSGERIDPRLGKSRINVRKALGVH